jgi:hypothetical protein
MAISDRWRAEWHAEAEQLDTSTGKIAKAIDLPVQEMLATLGGDLDATDEHGWSALMWAGAKGRLDNVKALLAAGANPLTESELVVSYNHQFFHVGMDACAIATKAGGHVHGCEAARRVGHFMFYTLNVDQRLLAAYRRLLLAAGLEPHMWHNDVQSSPLAWLEIELFTIAACVPPVTTGPVCSRFKAQGFAWHGPPPPQPLASDGPPPPEPLAGEQEERAELLVTEHKPHKERCTVQ